MTKKSIDIHAWLQTKGMTPAALCERLEIPRVELSTIIAGQAPTPVMLHYALIGLGSELDDVPAPAPIPRPIGVMPEVLCGSTWAEETARIGLPTLIREARSGARQTLTYTEFHEAVVKAGAKKDVGRLPKYAYVLGNIANAMRDLEMDDGEPVPPLTALVVNKVSGMPSEGINAFVYDYLVARDLPEMADRLEDVKARPSVFAIVWSDIFSYKRWDVVQSKLGFTGVPEFDR